MIVQKIDTHVTDALNRLLTQYRGLTYMTGLLSAIIQQIQNFEDAAYPVGSQCQLYNGTTYPAVGAQLDGIGQLVNLDRNGLTDAEYLLLILGTISANFSDTTWTSMLNTIKLMTQASNISTFNHYPASVSIALVDPQIDSSLWGLVGNVLQASLGAGINLCYIIVYNPASVFAFSGGKIQSQGFGPYSTQPQTSGGAWGSPVYEAQAQPVNYLTTQDGLIITTQDGVRITI